MSWTEVHPALNAVLNATAFVLLILGWRAIRTKRIERHRKLMVAAFTMSGIFLASYVTRFLLTGTHRYPAPDFTKTIYLTILGTHTILAVVVLPLILRLLFLARRQRFQEHRRLARVAFPIWAYVSLTGVIVYLMLYHLGPARAAALAALP
jgi:uncharacterized membrane protein YozB (DUF420 family)